MAELDNSDWEELVDTQDELIEVLKDENVRLRVAVSALTSVNDSDLEDADEPDTPRRLRNGIFTDALRYGANRIDKRKESRRAEREAAKEAKARMRKEAARKRS